MRESAYQFKYRTDSVWRNAERERLKKYNVSAEGRKTKNANYRKRMATEKGYLADKWNSVKQILNPKAKPEILKMINDPSHHLKEYGHAIKRLERHGYKDIVRFAQGTGLQISVPEDIGFDRFYYNIRGIDTFLKSHFGISTGGKAEKVFRWFDTITWDRVFTSAKLHTFMTVLNNPTKMGVKNPMAIMPRDNHATIYRKATQAAQFTNDAFGGQNWEMIANRIQTPILKRMMQTTFQPGSRGYMQLYSLLLIGQYQILEL